MPDVRELKIPKTFLELEGNDLFNYDPAIAAMGPRHQEGIAAGPADLERRSLQERRRTAIFALSIRARTPGRGRTAMPSFWSLPLSFLTATPGEHRVVNTWGESWVLKAAHKVETIPDDPLWIEHPHVLLDALTLDDELKKYKLVDTDGQAFADAALSEREDNRQLGANNFWLAPHFIKRLGHLGWGFGPSITALGLASAFDHDNSPVSVHRTYSSCLGGFPAGQKDPVSGAQYAGRFLEQKGIADPSAARRRHLYPERQFDRYGHDRHLAVRPASGGPGGDPLPVDLSWI